MSEDLTLKVRADASLVACFEAVTRAELLTQWLSEFADVDLPSRYQVWGRYVPGGDQPRQTLLDSSDHSVRFEWEIADTVTVVSIDLERIDELATSIAVTQTDFDPLDEGPLGQLQTFWALALANLVDLLEERGTDAACGPHQRCASRRSRPRRTGPCRVRVAHLFREGERLVRLPDRSRASREGGQFGYGRIRQLDPDRRMSVDFPGMGTATWELEGSEGHTRLVISQSGFDPNEPPYAAWMGVLSGIAELRRFHELPAWRTMLVARGSESIMSTTQAGSRSATSTQALLTCAVVACPLFVVTVLIQAMSRAGFDARVHAPSMLALGDLGWIQTTNFILCGALVLVSAIGFRRALVPGRGRTWGPILIGLFGLGLVWGGTVPHRPCTGLPRGRAGRRL